ncbi:MULTISPECIES: hypothetical protein [unclassified Flavobacterium]|uniref:hypothetical protein n=1 Tax=unclassified Flavobacterium TaxID=196869 RepID=UPI0008688E9E|nr:MULTISPECIES: hypothetical protein [unclassified Flavobacterium]MBN9285337.1 hypothetical protein [Flavobacterium sp.]ODS79118.1 MAG: hypothetical protein ABS44_21345 [Chryseobacterium sp. SCN 40-13]OJV71622.1 MAG: hypothetical protein BGO42_12230 [Flavobacterium sp. 40-81]
MNTGKTADRRVNETEIEKLYAFTGQHYVAYYDVQTELVDHLANAIEAQWAINPAISFDEALKIEFRKFGVFGFTTILEERQAALTGKYNRRILAEFRRFFRLPKIILVIATVYVVFQLLNRSDYPDYSILGLFVITFFIEGIAAFLWLNKNKKQQKITGKKWLLESIMKNIYFSFPLLFLSNGFNIIYQIMNKIEMGFRTILLFSILLVLLYLFLYIRMKILPKIFQEEMNEIVKKHQIIK